MLRYDCLASFIPVISHISYDRFFLCFCVCMSVFSSTVAQFQQINSDKFDGLGL